MDCTIADNKLVTLSSAVKASIIDKYEDISKVEQRYSHWAARELKQLYIQVLPQIKNKATLTVNPNTKTATLPLGFSCETFVGGINENWEKVPFKLNTRLVDSKNITDIPCEDKCVKCGQDTSICNDLVITEDTEIVVINDTPYNKTIIKKLYPNGDYYLETSTPVWDVDEEEIKYIPKKEFITNFDLKPCGCLETTVANIVTLQTYCPDIYCNYYSGCGTCNTAMGGYKIFEESGLIQFDINYPYERCYIEYNGFIQKIRGQYFIPYLAFETVVEGIKRRAIKNKPNVQRWQILDQNEEYRIAKRDLQKVLGRVSLAQIILSINQLPKFDIDSGYDYYGCFSASTVTVPATSSNILAAASISIGGSSGSGASCSTVNNNYITINNTGGLTIAVMVDGNPGSPVAGESTYQNNLLIGATVPYIILAKQVLTFLNGDFTVDDVTGTIDISPNSFFTGDSLIINYSK